MSDDAKTKPGPEPERLVIEGDPGEALDKLLGKRSGGEGEWFDFVDGVEPQPAPRYGRYLCEVRSRHGAIERHELHRGPVVFWRIRGRAPLPSDDVILRCRWLGELPE